MAEPAITPDTDFLTAYKERLSALGFDPKYVGYSGGLDKSVKRLGSAQGKIKGKKRIDTAPLRKSDRAWSMKLTPEQRDTISSYKEYDAAREEVARKAAESLNTPKNSLLTRQEAARMVVDELSSVDREKQFVTENEPTKKSTQSIASSDSFPAYSPTMRETKPSDFSKIESSVPSSFSPVSIGDPLEKRKLLAEELRQFAAGKSKETAQSLKEQGGEIGVTPSQLSSLYQRYKEEGKAKSTFEQEEEGKLARSQASGAFGGDDWRGRSSANSVSTPNLDQYASDKFGARPMGSETRMITSPEGQMRLMARKAARAGIDVGQLISANRGDVMAAFGELEASGLGARGIRSQEEVRARPELASQMREAKADLLKQQAEEFREAEADRIAKEEADRKEKERLAKEEEDRKEKERLAAEKEGDITAQRGVGELANSNSRPSRDSSPRLANLNSRPTNPNRA